MSSPTEPDLKKRKTIRTDADPQATADQNQIPRDPPSTNAEDQSSAEPTASTEQPSSADADVRSSIEPTPTIEGPPSSTTDVRPSTESTSIPRYPEQEDHFTDAPWTVPYSAATHAKDPEHLRNTKSITAGPIGSPLIPSPENWNEAPKRVFQTTPTPNMPTITFEAPTPAMTAESTTAAKPTTTSPPPVPPMPSMPPSVVGNTITASGRPRSGRNDSLEFFLSKHTGGQGIPPPGYNIGRLPNGDLDQAHPEFKRMVKDFRIPLPLPTFEKVVPKLEGEVWVKGREISVRPPGSYGEGEEMRRWVRGQKKEAEEEMYRPDVNMFEQLRRQEQEEEEDARAGAEREQGRLAIVDAYLQRKGYKLVQPPAEEEHTGETTDEEDEPARDGDEDRMQE